MADYRDPELLRYVALILVGLVLIGTGLIAHTVTGQLESQIPSLISGAATKAQEGLPLLQSLQSLLPTAKLFVGFIVLAGLFTIVSGVLSIVEYRRRMKPPAWAYYGQTQEPTQAQQ